MPPNTCEPLAARNVTIRHTIKVPVTTSRYSRIADRGSPKTADEQPWLTHGKGKEPVGIQSSFPAPLFILLLFFCANPLHDTPVTKTANSYTALGIAKVFPSRIKYHQPLLRAYFLYDSFPRNPLKLILRSPFITPSALHFLPFMRATHALVLSEHLAPFLWYNSQTGSQSTTSASAKLF